MLNLIFLIIFLISLIGIGIILIRKIPVLVQLSPQKVAKPEIFRKLKNKVKNIKNNRPLKNFSSEILLQKILSKIRILTLKTENKTSCWLGKLRKRSSVKKKKFSDDYWQKIRKEK